MTESNIIPHTLNEEKVLGEWAIYIPFLSRNFGHQLALTAGLSYVGALEAVLILDGDLKDPPELLKDFYAYLKKGFAVVYGVRKSMRDSF